MAKQKRWWLGGLGALAAVQAAGLGRGRGIAASLARMAMAKLRQGGRGKRHLSRALGFAAGTRARRRP
jgi:hypothetical protein